MASHLNDIDLEYFGFFKSYNIKPIMDKLGDRQRFKSWITLFKYMPDVYYHIDNDELTSKTLLYYCNIVWEPNYGGETIICNPKGEPELAIASRPNRVVLFDSYLPHKPTGLSPLAAGNRFSFVSIFK